MVGHQIFPSLLKKTHITEKIWLVSIEIQAKHIESKADEFNLSQTTVVSKTSTCVFIYTIINHDSNKQVHKNRGYAFVSYSGICIKWPVDSPDLINREPLLFSD